MVEVFTVQMCCQTVSAFSSENWMAELPQEDQDKVQFDVFDVECLVKYFRIAASSGKERVRGI